MFYHIFLSPQVKRWAVITYKHGIYKLPHELPSDLRVTSQEIRKYQESVLTSQNDSLAPSPPAKMKILLILAKNSGKTEMKLLP